MTCRGTYDVQPQPEALLLPHPDLSAGARPEGWVVRVEGEDLLADLGDAAVLAGAVGAACRVAAIVAAICI